VRIGVLTVACSSFLRKQAKEKRKKGGDPGSDEYLGPWAPPVDEAAPEQLVRSTIDFPTLQLVTVPNINPSLDLLGGRSVRSMETHQ